VRALVLSVTLKLLPVMTSIDAMRAVALLPRQLRAERL
jgi:hypothetical protein